MRLGFRHHSLVYYCWRDLLFHLHHLQDSHTVPTIQNAPDRASAHDSAVRIRGLHFDYGLSARKWCMISPWSLVWVIVLMEVDWHAFPGRKADCPLFFDILVEYFQIQMNTFETFFCFPMFSYSDYFACLILVSSCVTEWYIRYNSSSRTALPKQRSLAASTNSWKAGLGWKLLAWTQDLVAEFVLLGLTLP